MVNALHFDVSEAEHTVYRIADERIEVFPEDRVVVVDGAELPTQARQFDILSLLARQSDHIVSVPAICEAVWQDHEALMSDSVFTQVRALRMLLGEELGDRKTGAIVTKPGLGYRAVSSLEDKIILPHEENDPVYLIADERVAVNPTATTVRSDGRLMDDISAMEFKLLAELARRPDRTLGWFALVSEVWGHAYLGEAAKSNLAVHVSNLRTKLGSELGDTRTGALRTRRGIGYYSVSSLGVYPQVQRIF